MCYFEDENLLLYIYISSFPDSLGPSLRNSMSWRTVVTSASFYSGIMIVNAHVPFVQNLLQTIEIGYSLVTNRKCGIIRRGLAFLLKGINWELLIVGGQCSIDSMCYDCKPTYIFLPYSQPSHSYYHISFVIFIPSLYHHIP